MRKIGHIYLKQLDFYLIKYCDSEIDKKLTLPEILVAGDYQKVLKKPDI